jgi:hypothetical protein
MVEVGKLIATIPPEFRWSKVFRDEMNSADEPVLTEFIVVRSPLCPVGGEKYTVVWEFKASTCQLISKCCALSIDNLGQKGVIYEHILSGKKYKYYWRKNNACEERICYLGNVIISRQFWWNLEYDGAYINDPSVEFSLDRRVKKYPAFKELPLTPKYPFNKGISSMNACDLQEGRWLVERSHLIEWLKQRGGLFYYNKTIDVSIYCRQGCDYCESYPCLWEMNKRFLVFDIEEMTRNQKNKDNQEKRSLSRKIASWWIRGGPSATFNLPPCIEDGIQGLYPIKNELQYVSPKKRRLM